MLGASDAAYQIRNETSAAHALDGHLGGLCLLFAVHQGDVADVDLHEVVSSGAHSELSHGLDEGHALNVSHSTTQLDDTHIRLFASVVHRDLCNSFNPVLDGVDNVGNDLDRVTEIVAFTLLLNNVCVDFSRRDVVLAGQSDVEVAFVVAKVEVDLAAVVEDEDFTVS